MELENEEGKVPDAKGTEVGTDHCLMSGYPVELWPFGGPLSHAPPPVLVLVNLILAVRATGATMMVPRITFQVAKCK